MQIGADYIAKGIEGVTAEEIESKTEGKADCEVRIFLIASSSPGSTWGRKKECRFKVLHS